MSLEAFRQASQELRANSGFPRKFAPFADASFKMDLVRANQPFNILNIEDEATKPWFTGRFPAQDLVTIELLEEDGVTPMTEENEDGEVTPLCRVVKFGKGPGDNGTRHQILWKMAAAIAAKPGLKVGPLVLTRSDEPNAPFILAEYRGGKPTPPDGGGRGTNSPLGGNGAPATRPGPRKFTGPARRPEPAAFDDSDWERVTDEVDGSTWKLNPETQEYVPEEWTPDWTLNENDEWVPPAPTIAPKPEVIRDSAGHILRPSPVNPSLLVKEVVFDPDSGSMQLPNGAEVAVPDAEEEQQSQPRQQPEPRRRGRPVGSKNKQKAPQPFEILQIAWPPASAKVDKIEHADIQCVVCGVHENVVRLTKVDPKRWIVWHNCDGERVLWEIKSA